MTSTKTNTATLRHAPGTRYYARTFSATTKHVINLDDTTKTLCGGNISFPEWFICDDGATLRRVDWSLLGYLPTCRRCEASARKRGWTEDGPAPEVVTPAAVEDDAPAVEGDQAPAAQDAPRLARGTKVMHDGRLMIVIRYDTPGEWVELATPDWDGQSYRKRGHWALAAEITPAHPVTDDQLPALGERPTLRQSWRVLYAEWRRAGGRPNGPEYQALKDLQEAYGLYDATRAGTTPDTMPNSAMPWPYASLDAPDTRRRPIGLDPGERLDADTYVIAYHRCNRGDDSTPFGVAMCRTMTPDRSRLVVAYVVLEGGQWDIIKNVPARADQRPQDVYWFAADAASIGARYGAFSGV